jgi:carbon storage regulator
MLTLTRRSGESIRIGEDILVVIKEVHGQQVKLSIQAPPKVRVLREELYQKLLEANRAAQHTLPESIESWLEESGK